MVVSAHPIASDIGSKILKEGGNAVDAAVAVNFALAVVYPRAGNIGGGGFMVLRSAGGNSVSLDFREKAPLSAGRDMYLDSDGNVIPDISLKGHLACGVPGAVDGMVKAHSRFGKLPWAKLIQPSIDVARRGFTLTQQETDKINQYRDDFKAVNGRNTPFNPASGFKVGEKLIQENLAKTLERIRDQGEDGFYKGKTAQYLVDEMKKKGGIISFEDLAAYNAIWRSPVLIPYKEYTLISMPPPSSGGILLGQLMTMSLSQNLSELEFHSTEAVHVMVEAERRAYADRAKHLGDPDFFDVPQKDLMKRNYLFQRMSNFSRQAATNSDSIFAGVFENSEREETTHFCVVDSAGNAVSITTTLNTNYGSKVVIEGGGFLMNNEMDDFSAKPGVPNAYGLIGNEANAIEAEKRMLSSMTPTIVEKEGKLFMVVGTPGGSTIITSVYQTILNVTDFGLDLKRAVHAPRFHHQWKPNKVFYEEGAFDAATADELKNLGHELEERASIGRVEAIIVEQDGSYYGVADNRGDDHASGVN